MSRQIPPVRHRGWGWCLGMAAWLGLAVLAGACAKVDAKTPAPLPPPPLVTPAPEPRMIIPVPAEPDEPPPPPATTTSAPAPRRDTGTAKPPPAPTAPPTPPPAAPPEPQPVLQPTASMGQVETDARNLLASANHNLNRVQVWTLDTQGLANWRHARNLVALASRMLELKSYDYAKQVAGKAARLAALLIPGEAN